MMFHYKLLIVRFTEQIQIYNNWKNTIILISWSAIEKDTIVVQNLVEEKEAFFTDHTSLSLLLFAFFTVGHLIFSINLIIIASWNSQMNYIQIWGEPMVEYEHFQKVIIIYKLIIQCILWIPTLRRVQTT